jgi:hypothetical protein
VILVGERTANHDVAAVDFHLDALLNLPNLTVESGVQEGQQVSLKLWFLNEAAPGLYCEQLSNKLNQNRLVLIRDLSILRQTTFVDVLKQQPIEVREQVEEVRLDRWDGTHQQ